MTENTWLARKTAALPEGRLIVWFGAGVSKASGMPLGYGLTAQWLRHYLPDGEADTILALFADNAKLLKKDLPRLEKVIEDARWTFGIDCLKNLDLFRLCRPNALHRAIADHIVAHRLYAITTNFDTAVEECWPGVIPVMTPATGITADWGLLKLHGSLGEDLATLGHSIANLQAGLPAALRELVETLLDNPGNTMVFCGYSGADFFDIAPLFQDRASSKRPFAARVVWLHHAVAAAGDVDTCGVGDREWTDDKWKKALSTGARAMLWAFDPARKEGRAGDTRALLAELMPLPEVPDPSPETPWWGGWEKRFRPDADGRNHAVQALRAAEWGRLGRQDDDKSGHGCIEEAVSSLKLSYRIAGLIGDPMGRIKALRLLSGIARRCGHHRIAAGRQRLAVELENRQALAARLAYRRAEAWVRRG